MGTFAKFLLVSLLLTQACLASNAEKCVYIDSRKFPDNRREDEMYSALYAAADGTVYVGLCTYAGSAQFYSYDPRNDRIRHLADMADFLHQTGKGIRTAGKIHT